MGWKIDDLNPIWVRLLGWSQLSNPLDLPCYIFKNTLSNQVYKYLKIDTLQKMSEYSNKWYKFQL